MDRTSFDESKMPGMLVAASFVQPDFSSASSGIHRTVAGLAFLPHPLPPQLPDESISGALVSNLLNAERLLTRLDSKVSLHGAMPEYLLTLLRQREAQQSSRIENTFASLEQIAMAGRDETRDTNADEVARNIEMIHLAVESYLPVSCNLVQQMHRTLIIDPLMRPGQFRDRQVLIGGSHDFATATFIPPPPMFVPECMMAWQQFVTQVRDRSTQWPYWVAQAMLHYQFEAIHPFSDGNGRIGRALINVSPVKDGILNNPVCYISEWLANHRREYYDRLLAVSTRGEWLGWIDFFCRALAGQADIELQRVDRLISLRQRLIATCKQINSSHNFVDVLDEVFREIFIDANRLQKSKGVAKPTAHRYINAMVKANILQPAPTGRGLYYCKPILDAVKGTTTDAPL